MTTVFITGASKGIGRSIAQKLANKDGFTIIGTCRNSESVENKIAGVRYVSLDLTNQESIAACSNIMKDVDILINNAGQSQIGSVEDVSVEKIKALFEINLFGTIAVTKQVIPYMRLKKKGLIINIGSMTGTFPLPLYASYCSSKAALQMFSMCMRQELCQFGITVIHVEPNDIKTTITPDLIFNERGAYANLAKTVREKVKLKMDKAEDPVIVANLIEKILACKHPKPLYTVGGNGNFLVFLKRFVSHRFIEKSTMKMYGL